MTLGTHLATCLDRADLSQRAAAKLAGISQTFMSLVIRGEKLPSVSTLERLLTAANASPAAEARAWKLLAAARCGPELMQKVSLGANAEMVARSAGWLAREAVSARTKLIPTTLQAISHEVEERMQEIL